MQTRADYEDWKQDQHGSGEPPCPGPRERSKGGVREVDRQNVGDAHVGERVVGPELLL